MQSLKILSGDKPIWVHGLYRSGTNYLQEICNSSFGQSVSTGESYGKEPYHHAAHIDKTQWHHNDMSIVMIWKTPEKWIDSLHRKSFDLYHEQDWYLEQGEEIVWLPYDVDSEPALFKNMVPFSLDALCRYYSQHCHLWKSIIKRWSHSIVSHHSLVQNRDRVLYKIKQDLGMGNFTLNFKDPIQVRNSGAFTQVTKDRYIDPNWFEYLSDKQVEYIRKRTKESWETI